MIGSKNLDFSIQNTKINCPALSFEGYQPLCVIRIGLPPQVAKKYDIETLGIGHTVQYSAVQYSSSRGEH